MSLSRDEARRATPRLDLPLSRRVSFALAWYRDGIRSADVAATAKLSGRQLVSLVRSAGHPLRSESHRSAELPLLHVLRAVQGGATAAGLRETFGLQQESIAGIFALLWQSHPPVVRRRSPELEVFPPRKCGTCRGLTTSEPGSLAATCRWCGDPL